MATQWSGASDSFDGELNPLWLDISGLVVDGALQPSVASLVYLSPPSSPWEMADAEIVFNISQWGDSWMGPGFLSYYSPEYAASLGMDALAGLTIATDPAVKLVTVGDPIPPWVKIAFGATGAEYFLSSDGLSWSSVAVSDDSNLAPEMVDAGISFVLWDGSLNLGAGLRLESFNVPAETPPVEPENGLTGLLIPVTMLSVKLGKTFAPGSLQQAQAEQAIWTASVRARSIAGKTLAPEWAGYDVPGAAIPDAVKSVILEASYRIFKNPQRYVMNQAFQFTGQISHEMDGDIFLRAERSLLEQFNNNGMWVQGTIRDRYGHSRAGYVAVAGSNEPFPYYGEGEG